MHIPRPKAITEAPVHARMGRIGDGHLGPDSPQEYTVGGDRQRAPSSSDVVWGAKSGTPIPDVTVPPIRFTTALTLIAFEDCSQRKTPANRSSPVTEPSTEN
ncbi:hypothetical protein JTE90_002027 [Oedothorax gibbosus]|uniref:Uncharacterized protein n=1 Tax=Oedothorax gibbosus TaxID=931172 RepID=A0AAV6UQ99_9ARAC|nr:hypothetical protein JTE90_002027 [Oedothorax gibbosus]